jgi:hypothetical protein
VVPYRIEGKTAHPGYAPDTPQYVVHLALVLKLAERAWDHGLGLESVCAAVAVNDAVHAPEAALTEHPVDTDSVTEPGPWHSDCVADLEQVWFV